MLEVNKSVEVTVWVTVTDGLGIERQEHAEDRIGAASFASAVGIAGALTARLTAVGTVSTSSEVINVTVVVVSVLFARVSRIVQSLSSCTYEISVKVEVRAVSVSVPVVMVVVMFVDLNEAC